MKRALAVLLLVTLLPAVQAGDGVELRADDATRSLAASAQAGQPVQATVTYTLDLAAPLTLRLLSSVRDAAGAALPHNATWRLDGNVVGTTQGASPLTTGPVPAGSHPLVLVWSLDGQAAGALQLQAFARREASGGGGTAAGFSGALAQTSLQVARSGLPAAPGSGPATAGGATPVLLALSFDRRPEGTTLSWGSSVPAVGEALVQGPAGSAQRTLPSGVHFTADLGQLPDGVYLYNVSARDAAGRTGYLSGQVRLEGTGSGAPLPAALERSLAQTLRTPLQNGSVFLVDGDRDGHPDRVVDAAGLLVLVRAMPQQGRFIVHSVDDPALVLVEANTGNVRAVQSLAGALGSDAASGGGRQVKVNVAQKEGWILVAVHDPHPAERLLGVQRADGTPLPAESVWQASGVIQFADDPAATYTLLYAVPPSSGITLGTGLALLGAGLLAGAVAMLLVRRRVQ